MSLIFILAVTLGALLGFTVLLAMMFRVVVPTNDVHIVQSAKKTLSYGRGEAAGNTYYKWPSWVPVIGIKTISLPVSVFDVDLDGYAAYDQGRVPFVVDIMAFFRITDSNLAAQRVHTFEELKEQLRGILQGACRTILAKSEIEQILEGRSQFGELFTKEVDNNLEQWGVQTVKMIELMDIRDAQGSKVINNIMAKKQSLIERHSRIEVAENSRAAEVAEIEARRDVELRNQEAQQQVGMRTAEKERHVGTSNEQSQQAIMEEKRTTAEKNMGIKRVEELRQAEITREVQIVAADQESKTLVIVAEGKLREAELNALGIKVEGEAKGAAEQAILMAPVNTQITLAKEIGQNKSYQDYLIQIRVVEKDETVGVKQAEALKEADIKVIANTGEVTSGVHNVMDLFTSKGGTQLAAMAEAFKQTPTGAAILGKLTQNGAGDTNYNLPS